MVTRTRTYTDLDAVFTPNLVTGDVAIRKDNAAIIFAVKSLVLTKNFERPFNSSIGSQAHRLLFEPMDDFTKITLERAIITSIENHEPRVTVKGITVDFDEDHNAGTINIVFIINQTNIVQTVSVALDRTR